MFTCPYHKTELVYVGKFMLGCTGRVSKNGKSWKCQHIQYTSSENPKGRKHE